MTCGFVLLRGSWHLQPAHWRNGGERDDGALLCACIVGHIAMAHDGGCGRVRASSQLSRLVQALYDGQEGETADLLQRVARTAESITPCRVIGMVIQSSWQDIGGHGRGLGAADALTAAAAPGGGLVGVPGIGWAWAYPIPTVDGQAGALVAGAQNMPTEADQVRLFVLGQLTGLALGNADLHAREQAEAARLRANNLALQRTLEIRDRLRQVTSRGEGLEGIATALCELTDHPAGIEDTFGNLIAWAGPGRPDPPCKHTGGHRARPAERAVEDPEPVREDDWLISVAQLAGAPVGAVVLADPDRTAGAAERLAMQQATLVLVMEVARQQSLDASLGGARAHLALDLVNGADELTCLSRAQALGYDLARPHRVVALERLAGPGDQDEVFFHAVRRAAQRLGIGSLIALRRGDVIVLADSEAPWERLHAAVEAESKGVRCSIGVGGLCRQVADFPRSHREGQLALRIQRAAGRSEQVTVFDDLGVFQVLATEADTSAMEAFVNEWLGALMTYDSDHGAHLVATLSEFLYCGGSYDVAAAALTIHRSTLKYRLKRIRAISGHDIGVPDTQFNLQVATRAFRTLQALRGSLSARSCQDNDLALGGRCIPWACRGS
ncbi:MAG: helix-turn-helix domain-containing protein [Streptosporangiaceae bacterium]